MSSSKPIMIISGAQTGVDRAALDAALDLGFPCTGWCPSGRLDEAGIIPERYPVKELKKGGFLLRTIQNLTDADGTLIFYFGELEGGTQNTLLYCLKQKRPCCLVHASEIKPERAAQLALQFVQKRKLKTLNVAGPRASKCPEGYSYAYEVVFELLRMLENTAP